MEGGGSSLLSEHQEAGGEPRSQPTASTKARRMSEGVLNFLAQLTSLAGVSQPWHFLHWVPDNSLLQGRSCVPWDILQRSLPTRCK